MELAVVADSVLPKLGPYAVVAIAGIERWREREPDLFRKVLAWMDERGIMVVQA